MLLHIHYAVQGAEDSCKYKVKSFSAPVTTWILFLWSHSLPSSDEFLSEVSGNSLPSSVVLKLPAPKIEFWANLNWLKSDSYNFFSSLPAILLAFKGPTESRRLCSCFKHVENRFEASDRTLQPFKTCMKNLTSIQYN